MVLIPNLFLAGAPKCGTTSLYDWLAQHPDIFAPAMKEPIYFGSDLTSRNTRRTLADYQSLYMAREDQRYALDGSTHYFYAREAGKEIKAAVPGARILIALRDPAEAAHSMFHQLVFNGVENLAEFADSLAAEESRSAAPLPIARGFPENRLYSRVFAYRENIGRFLDAFGVENVKIVLLDDLRSDARMCLSDIFGWLRIDAGPARTIRLDRQNGAKVPRSRLLNGLASYPPPWLGRMAAPILSPDTRYRLRNWLRQMNIRPSTNPPIDASCRTLLIERHESDISWLESHLGRDLKDWRQ